MVKTTGRVGDLDADEAAAFPAGRGEWRELLARSLRSASFYGRPV